ncbi:EAL domain-containing protein [Pseudomonas aeruginosa]|uniref:sensor domain-containing phosphodiesterase n=1 Tax=Pseudomonas aeruginosa TaxID=287 RepID=UPI00188F0F52|nr:EAL domain-containing protein [Pseudomonas aeruginosa]
MTSNPIFPSGIGTTQCRDRLLAALEDGHIWPGFQPIVDLHTGAIAGYEVLARWTDPVAGDIAPLVFIPMLEQLDMADDLTRRLMGSACAAAGHWAGDFFLAFNVTPAQLVDKGLPGLLAATTANSGFTSKRVEVEVTEGSLIADQESAFHCLEALIAQGISVSIDDFGTGYSNLERLGAFPFDKLKIDQRFIRGVERDAGKRRIVASLIGLGHSLGMSVVAEGIESPDEEAILRALGCNLGQGWLYGKAACAADAGGLLARRGVLERRHGLLDTSPFQQFHQLATLYAQAPVGLSFLDKQLRHVRANAQFSRMHGLTPTQIEGKSMAELMDANAAAEVERRLRKILAGGNPGPADYKIHGRDVRVITQAVADVGGEVIGLSAVSIDITEQKRMMWELAESEKHFRRSVELSPNIAWAADADGTIDYMSPLFDETEQLTPAQRVSRWFARIHPDDVRRAQTKWMDHVKTDGPYTIEFRIRWADGNFRWVRSRARPFREVEHGPVVRWYGVVSEISDEKRLEERLALLGQTVGAAATGAPGMPPAQPGPGVTLSAASRRR